MAELGERQRLKGYWIRWTLRDQVRSRYRNTISLEGGFGEPNSVVPVWPHICRITWICLENLVEFDVSWLSNELRSLVHRLINSCIKQNIPSLRIIHSYGCVVVVLRPGHRATSSCLQDFPAEQLYRLQHTSHISTQIECFFYYSVPSLQTHHVIMPQLHQNTIDYVTHRQFPSQLKCIRRSSVQVSVCEPFTLPLQHSLEWSMVTRMILRFNAISRLSWCCGCAVSLTVAVVAVV